MGLKGDEQYTDWCRISSIHSINGNIVKSIGYIAYFPIAIGYSHPKIGGDTNFNMKF